MAELNIDQIKAERAWLVDRLVQATQLVEALENSVYEIATQAARLQVDILENDLREFDRATERAIKKEI